MIEVGAGSGIMAAEILLELERLDLCPEQYLIIEISTSLRQRQRETIQSKAPHLIENVRWLETLPENKCQAIVLANEVLDAMPVECFQTTGDGHKQLYVEVEDNKAKALYRDAQADVLDAIDTIEQREVMEFEDNYQSEFNPVLDGWLVSFSNILDRGVILIIDYGYSASEYYHAQRHMGTLMCHYQHRAHPDPFWYPGLQDITAFVDFTAVAYGAVEADMEVRGYTTQAAF